LCFEIGSSSGARLASNSPPLFLYLLSARITDLHSHSQLQPLVLFYFIVLNYLPGLAENHDPPDLCFMSPAQPPILNDQLNYKLVNYRVQFCLSTGGPWVISTSWLCDSCHCECGCLVHIQDVISLFSLSMETLALALGPRNSPQGLQPADGVLQSLTQQFQPRVLQGIACQVQLHQVWVSAEYRRDLSTSLSLQKALPQPGG
jgi:hypothetical protein